MVDNLKKMKENVKKNEFPKIAGYKINLPFGAAFFTDRLTVRRKNSMILWKENYYRLKIQEKRGKPWENILVLTVSAGKPTRL